MGGRFAILVAAMFACAGTAFAQSTDNRIFGFGDSYADTNDPNDPGGVLQAKGAPFPSNLPEGRFSSGENFVDRLQKNFGIADDDNINFAFGGALTDESNIGNHVGFDPRPTGFLSQVSLASGETFSSKDIIALSVGGNNMLAALLDLPVASGGATAFALRSAVQAATGVQTLVDQGARIITVIPSGGDPALFPTLSPDPTAVQRAQDFALQYSSALQRELAPIAAQGVRVNFFNYPEFQRRLFGNGQPFNGELARFGFLDAAAQGLPNPTSVPCQAGPPPDPGNCDPADAGTFFYWDTVHLTEAGYNLMADFMTIQLVQNETIPVQTELAQIQALNFTETLHQRMQARRNGATGFEVNYSANNAVDLKGQSNKDEPRAHVDDVFALFVSGGFAGGERDARDGIVGYDYALSHIVVGGEWKADEHVYLGAAVGYTNTQADYAFLRGQGETELDSINVGLYASVAYPNWFADLALGYSINSYDLSRTGFVSPFGEAIALDTSADTDGSSFTADFRTGYLFRSGALSFGPIAGLSYTHVTVGGYTESGDSLLTLNVEEQELDSLIGSIGVQIRYNAGRIEPYVAVTLEKEFLGNRSYDFALTSADVVVNAIDVGGDDNPFGRVRAGVKMQLSDQLTGSIDGSATFGRDSGDDYAITGSIKYRF